MLDRINKLNKISINSINKISSKMKDNSSKDSQFRESSPMHTWSSIVSTLARDTKDKEYEDFDIFNPRHTVKLSKK